jgi:type IV pilus assembly protein PilM
MNALSRFLRIEFRPPDYLALPTAGIDISTSGIKVVVIREKMHGLELVSCGELILPTGAVVGGEIADRKAVVDGLRTLTRKHHITIANLGLPEARGYLFEADIPENATRASARVAIEQRLEEYVPLPAPEVVFDFVRRSHGTASRAVGMGYGKRVVEETLSVAEEAGLTVRAIESETFALPRAVLPEAKQETVLIIDIGKTTTKLMVTTGHTPYYVTTLDIGGHALTLAVVKYFGVSEEEAKRVKIERGIRPDKENEEYLSAMISTVSVIRDEVLARLEYWQTHVRVEAGQEPVTRVILVGGNATVLGLSEYLESSLKLPVQLGDTFANLASPKLWKPSITRTESLAYGTAIGLALREYVA